MGILIEWTILHLLPALLADLSAHAIQRAAVDVASRIPDRRAPLQTTGRAGTWPLRLVPTTTVLSSTPGRLRLGVPTLKGNVAGATAVSILLRALNNTIDVRASAVTGTVLIEFDPLHVRSDEITAAVERLFTSEPAPHTASHRARQSLALVAP